MAHTSIWFHRFSHARPRHPAVSADDVARALSHDVSVVNSQEPETAGQWNLLKAQIELQDHHVPSTERPKAIRWLKPATLVGLAGATTVVVVGLLLQRPASPTTYHTGDRERNAIVLGDGSEVILNHNSDLSVNLKDDKAGRRTDLTGEAFFKVQKTGSPFIVNTDLGSVQVLGTEFNVRTRRGMMEVAVVSGRVCVTASREGKDSTVTLQGGEITAIARGAYPESPRRLPFMNDFPGWIHGKFLFNHTTLEFACREISDQFGVPITIDSPNLSGETITGVLDGRTAETAVKTLCLLSGASYRNDNNSYTLY